MLSWAGNQVQLFNAETQPSPVTSQSTTSGLSTFSLLTCCQGRRAAHIARDPARKKHLLCTNTGVLNTLAPYRTPYQASTLITVFQSTEYCTAP